MQGNLVRWEKKDDPTRPLCNGRQTAERALSLICKVALSQGRYTECYRNKHSKRASQINSSLPSFIQQRAGLRHDIGETGCWTAVMIGKFQQIPPE
ncbi:reverse transcriptase [Elysia marginata]|uniref:Reverse transcriptase n=1 Tax=Elysia marginata TaxID=1093978 RepID=A0AAV4I6Y8_9GAST|nr:reverse transcriptase [Elysia marginata]